MDTAVASSGFFSTWSSNVQSFLAVLAAFFLLARYSIQAAVQRFLASCHMVDHTQHLKFSESFWKFLYFSCGWIWGLYIILKEGFFWDTTLCWSDISKPISIQFRYFYLTQLAFYVQATVAHLTIEVKRKDFTQMLLHHLATILLISFSFGIRYTRVGALVLVTHDINDIIFEAGKMFIYANMHRVADRIFFLLLVCWLLSRLIIFPFKVIYSSSVESWNILYKMRADAWYIFNGLLVFILVLNVYWFGLMIRMLLHILRDKGANVEDSREKDD